MILRGLKRHHFPATGFVNEGKLDELNRDRQIANLKRWLDAGMVLGNHTFSHESPNTLGAAAYISDIARGELPVRGEGQSTTDQTTSQSADVDHSTDAQGHDRDG